ncbi:MAG: acyl-CoA thioesterase [Gemmatimonadota bacterium]
MIAIHTLPIDVPAEAIDAVGHVNNQVYLKWMQEAAMSHSDRVGWPMDRYFRLGSAWVVRSHSIEYLRPALEGDALHVHTWVDGMQERRSLRRYLFWRARDRSLVVRAETLWVFVDLETGRPRRIPDALRSDFTVVQGGEAAVLDRLGLAASAGS